ncbi:DUF305 domain-containing protein [Streptomyces sp. NBC_00887]|uniref:DUF305 domain-containing protein n=1 Tax=Streptomyces sp. NBC_00887 TaxID=2975859 RepID=UPI00386A7C50|nr:DUF305 domain-containing protein [Streptomyces sp. NBC_00887]
MKAVRRAAASLLLPLLLATGLTSCSASADPEPPPRPAAPPPSGPAPSRSGDPTDSAWVQLMIPMDEQAVALLAMAAKKTSDPPLRSWANRLRMAQNSELTALRGLRDRMGLPATDVHAGHNMPGMVTADDLLEARAAEGGAFDRMLVAQIRDHLRQSAQVSRSETTAGTRADARERARALVTARESQLADLDALAVNGG